MENANTSMGDIVSTAHNLITVINSTLQRQASQSSSTQNESTTSRPPPQINQPRPSVLQEMTRSFPGAFAKGRGKSRFVASKRKAPKEVTIPFYLLPKMTSKTPKPKEEFSLIQAGLGKKSLVVMDTSSHAELSEMLCQEFPKMQDLEGGWLFYKAMGGCGQRPITVVTPEAEGYTGALVQIASNGGKSTLFIVPLQKEMDLTPLPLSSKEFEKMPKAKCSRCNEQMPLPFLTEHNAMCAETPCEDKESDQDLADDDLEYVPPNVNVLTPEKLANVFCPICQGEYSSDVIEMHASSCGERSAENKENANEEIILKDANGNQSLDDLLQNLARQVDTSERFCLYVTRANFFHRALQQWKRQKKNSPKCSLKVYFVGEPGVDTGAIKKEFFTEMMSGIEERYFEPGTDNKGKNPIYSISALEENNFRSFGEIMAASLAQGGPSPAFMRNWCYTYLATGNFECMTVTPDDVTDTEAKALIEKVRPATNDEILNLSDELLACGYTGRINTDKKEAIIRTISLHSLARLLPLLDQIRKGLQLYSFLHVIEQNLDLCRPLFVPINDDKPDANFIMASCQPTYSDEGTSKRTLEQDIINHFQDFLQELEDDDDVPGDMESEDVSEEINQKPLTIPTILQWLTGQAHKPILPSERNMFAIFVKFNHFCEQDHEICFPVVSACTRTITFPVAHMSTYKEFKRVLSLAVRYGNVFGRI